MLKIQAIAAQLEFLAWRDSQLAAISVQVEHAFPALLDELTAHAESAGKLNLVRSTVSLKNSAQSIIQDWSAKELELALRRAEADLDQTLLQLPGAVILDGSVWDQMTKALPAIAGVGLIAASLAAIPTVISFATVSTSFLAFWGTSYISWPLFALGATGIGIATLTGSQSLKISEARARSKLRHRLHGEAGRQVFGIGAKPDARCVLSDIQAAIVRAGQNRIEGESK